MTTEVRQQIDAELKKAGITEVRSEMVVASAQQTEMRVSSVQKAETVAQGNFCHFRFSVFAWFLGFQGVSIFCFFVHTMVR